MALECDAHWPLLPFCSPHRPFSLYQITLLSTTLVHLISLYSHIENVSYAFLSGIFAFALRYSSNYGPCFATLNSPNLLFPLKLFIWSWTRAYLGKWGYRGENDFFQPFITQSILMVKLWRSFAMCKCKNFKVMRCEILEISLSSNTVMKDMGSVERLRWIPFQLCHLLCIDSQTTL